MTRKRPEVRSLVRPLAQPKKDCLWQSFLGCARNMVGGVMNCKEYTEFLQSDRSIDPTNPEWDEATKHAEACPIHLPDAIEAEADAQVLSGILLDKIPLRKW